MERIQTKDYAELSKQAARLVGDAIRANPTLVLGGATGSTPLGLYDELAAECAAGRLDFSRVRMFNLDEYAGLPQEHPQSYHHFMQEHLWGRVNLAPANVDIPRGTGDLAAECRRYEDAIRAAGGIDLQILGIGHDGHIGFNEPDDHFPKTTHVVDLTAETIQANARFFASADEVPRQAVTMGIATIMQARRILLLVNGAEKTAILQEALEGPITPQVPASVLQLHPFVTLVTDIPL